MRDSERTDPLLLRAEEVAQLLGVSKSMVFKLIAAGELPSLRLGHAVRVPAAPLREWVRERTTAKEAAPHRE